ncbi:hypothetical protein [Flagellimonas sp. GZD32]|uniref:hypothetical protein n=1 Tax=Flagellimonas cixiensis TaxID=3228750 RepID=UPI0035C89BB7
MKEQITVDSAIRRGHLMVNVPVFIAIIGCPALAFFLSQQNLTPGWVIGIAFPIGILIGWLIWSVMITKWRIWAFENVRNVHELKKRAIQEKLIWNDGNVFERSEIRNREERIKLKKLEKKFDEEDLFKEDYTLPPKIEIYYSKSYNYLELGVSLLIIGVGIYFLIMGQIKNYILGGIMCLIGFGSTIKEARKAFNYKPQLVIDKNGIKTKSSGFNTWTSITNEQVINYGYGKYAKSYLTFSYGEGLIEKIEINPLNVNNREMENIIRTYRLRNIKYRR